MKEKMTRLLSAVNCWPQNLVSLKFYKALAKVILNRQSEYIKTSLYEYRIYY
jgi:hypothetical protein